MTKDSTEAISVIIPTYNTARFIGAAIESVLEQTVKPGEVIVIDDGSTDETGSIVKKFKGNVRYQFQENSGVAAARNRGLELAQGKFLAFLDADDIWLKNKLEIQLDLMQKKPEFDMVIGLMKRVPYSRTIEIIEEGNIVGDYITSIGSTLIKKRVFDKIGTFDEEMIQAEDVDLFLRILESGINVWGHPDVVQICRWHNHNITLNEKQKNHYLLKAFKKSIDRRRKLDRNAVRELPELGNIDGLIKYWQSNQIP